MNNVFRKVKSITALNWQARVQVECPGYASRNSPLACWCWYRHNTNVFSHKLIFATNCCFIKILWIQAAKTHTFSPYFCNFCINLLQRVIVTPINYFVVFEVNENCWVTATALTYDLNKLLIQWHCHWGKGNKHCKVLVSCSDLVLGNFIELHASHKLSKAD